MRRSLVVLFAVLVLAVAAQDLDIGRKRHDVDDVKVKPIHKGGMLEDDQSLKKGGQMRDQALETGDKSTEAQLRRAKAVGEKNLDVGKLKGKWYNTASSAAMAEQFQKDCDCTKVRINQLDQDSLSFNMSCTNMTSGQKNYALATAYHLPKQHPSIFHLAFESKQAPALPKEAIELTKPNATGATSGCGSCGYEKEGCGSCGCDGVEEGCGCGVEEGCGCGVEEGCDGIEEGCGGGYGGYGGYGCGVEEGCGGGYYGGYGGYGCGVEEHSFQKEYRGDRALKGGNIDSDRQLKSDQALKRGEIGGDRQVFGGDRLKGDKLKGDVQKLTAEQKAGLKGNLVVLKISESGNHMLLASPDLDSVWILSKRQGINERMYRAFVKFAENEGFTATKIKKTGCMRRMGGGQRLKGEFDRVGRDDIGGLKRGGDFGYGGGERLKKGDQYKQDQYKQDQNIRF